MTIIQIKISYSKLENTCQSWMEQIANGWQQSLLVRPMAARFIEPWVKTAVVGAKGGIARGRAPRIHTLIMRAHRPKTSKFANTLEKFAMLKYVPLTHIHWTKFWIHLINTPKYLRESVYMFKFAINRIFQIPIACVFYIFSFFWMPSSSYWQEQRDHRF